MKKLIAGLCAGAVCVAALAVSACDAPADNKPVKIKDGITITVEEEKTETVDLSLYISIPEGTDYEYTVTSSAQAVATVAVNENIATITAVAEGNATVTASVEEVSVEFDVVVTKKSAPTVAADKTALKEELDREISEQGEYTQESYGAYAGKLEAAKTVYAKENATQTEVDTACAELTAAREGLTLRKPAEVAGADKSLSVLGGGVKEIALADYIDENGLANVTYEVTADNTDVVTVGEIEEGKVTLTAGTVENDTDVVITLKATKNGETTVIINLKVLSEIKPVLKQTAVEKSVDAGLLENKTLKLDLAENIDEDNGLTLTYAVNTEASGVTVTLDTDDAAKAVCVFNGTYAETAATVEVKVTVNYGEGKHVEYTYILNVCDTSAFRAQNGGFDSGLDGWTMDGDIGDISEDGYFWGDKPVFNVGKYFRGEAKEGNTGTLVSSTFKVGGINKITFMLGAAGAERCYITLEKADGTVLAVWRNTKFKDGVGIIGEEIFTLNLVTYVADLSAWQGETVRLVINDEATSGFGFVTFDELVTYYASEAELPAGAVVAVNQLADKTALTAKIAEAKVIEQGNYSNESFAVLTARIAEAEAVVGYKGATAQNVADAAAAIETAIEGLAEAASTDIYRVQNGDFENGWAGWTKVTQELRDTAIFSAETYGMGGFDLPYNQHGNYHLNGWDVQTGIPESGNWAVKSSEFILGGSGWMSLRMGGNASAVKVYKSDGTLLGEYRQNHFNDVNFGFVGDEGGGWNDMRTYFIDLTQIAQLGDTLYLELCDVAIDGGWANAFFDDVITYYETAPDIDSGYDTVRTAVSKDGDQVVYGDVQLSWRLATKQ